VGYDNRLGLYFEFSDAGKHTEHFLQTHEFLFALRTAAKMLFNTAPFGR
jgi:hypothetical protein